MKIKKYLKSILSQKIFLIENECKTRVFYQKYFFMIKLTSGFFILL